MEKVLCNYCKATTYDILYRIPDLYLDKKDVVYSLVKCRKCGLIYQNPRPTQDEIRESYPNTYESFNFDQKKSWLDTKTTQYGLDKRSKTITSFKRNYGLLLDIGCSSGLFINAMQNKYGWKTYGVEPDEYSSRIAIEKYHLNVFHGNLDQASYSTSSFDAITLWDVLEHMSDPSSTLQEIKRILKPDGILVLRVPNYDSCDARLFGSAWSGLDVPRHYYVFSQNSLARLLEKNGFSIHKKVCNSGSYPMFLISLRFLMNKQLKDSYVQRAVRPLINHPFAQTIFAPYFVICGLFLRGPAITVTAFKKDNQLVQAG